MAGALGGAAVLIAALSRVTPNTSYWLVGAALLLIGVGVGAAFVPSTDAVMAAVPKDVTEDRAEQCENKTDSQTDEIDCEFHKRRLVDCCL